MNFPKTKFHKNNIIYCFVILFMAVLLGIAISPLWGHGQYYRHGNIFHRLLSWDALWYRNVAVHGYVWHSDGWKLEHYTNLDFFPVYPMIEKSWSLIFGFNSISMLTLSALFGLISIFSVYRLAFQITSDNAAAWRAAMVYSVWPASYCFFTGYPTGFINICAAEALLAWVNRKSWKAAVWTGLGAGTAPTMVFLAAAFCLDKGFKWLKKPNLSSLPEMFAFGLATVWGLLTFIMYLGIHFGDPFLFLKAQRAWGAPTPFFERFILIVNPLWYVLPIIETVNALIHGTTSGTAEIIFQRMTNLFSIVFLFLILWRSRRGKFRQENKIPEILWLSGISSILGYMWFLGTTAQNLTATVRLLYPVMIIFMWFAIFEKPKTRILFPSMIFIGFLLTSLQISFVVSGYSVI